MGVAWLFFANIMQLKFGYF